MSNLFEKINLQSQKALTYICSAKHIQRARRQLAYNRQAFFMPAVKESVLYPRVHALMACTIPSGCFATGKAEPFFISVPAVKSFSEMRNTENKVHDNFCDILHGFFKHNDLPDIIEAINAANVSHISHPENDDAQSVADAVFLNTRATAFLLRLESAWRNVNPKNVAG